MFCICIMEYMFLYFNLYFFNTLRPWCEIFHFINLCYIIFVYYRFSINISLLVIKWVVFLKALASIHSASVFTKSKMRETLKLTSSCKHKSMSGNSCRPYSFLRMAGAYWTSWNRSYQFWGIPGRRRGRRGWTLYSTSKPFFLLHSTTLSTTPT